MSKVFEKSKNALQVAGTLLELNLEVQDREKVYLFDNDTKEQKIVSCKVVTKKDFKNPSMLLSCNAEGGEREVPVNLSDVNELKIEKGEVVTNPQFKERLTILDTYVAKNNCEADEIPTRVSVSYGVLKENEYVSKKDGFEWKEFDPTLLAYSVTSTGLPSEDLCEGEVTGVLVCKTPETDKDGEETGRLLVKFLVFKKEDSYLTIPFVVESDIAPDFDELLSVGDNCSVNYEVIVKQVGAKKVASSGGIGRRASKMVSGYTKVEYSIFAVSDPFEEEHKQFIDAKQVKVAKEAREVFIEAKLQKEKDKAKENGGASKSGGLGKRKPKMEEVETPFKDEDDTFDEFDF